jgi:hypothetical protein
MKELINSWKKLEISYAIFKFNCGGDSMNDTELYFYHEAGDEVDQDEILDHNLYEMMEDLIYERVEFYEASDGVYMGEFGEVEIKLTEDETDFEFIKGSTSEYNEHISVPHKIQLTEDEAMFCKKYLTNISRESFDGIQVNYSKDFIMTVPKEDMLDTLINKLESIANNYQVTGEDIESGTSYDYDEVEEGEARGWSLQTEDIISNDNVELEILQEIFYYVQD